MQPDKLIQDALTAPDQITGLKILRRPLDQAVTACFQYPPESEQWAKFKGEAQNFGGEILSRLTAHEVRYRFSGNTGAADLCGFYSRLMKSIVVESSLKLAGTEKEFLGIVTDNPEVIIEELIPAWTLKIHRAGKTSDVPARMLVTAVISVLGEPARLRFDSEQNWLQGRESYFKGSISEAQDLFAKSQELCDIPGLYKAMFRKYREIGDFYADLKKEDLALKEYEKGLIRSELLRANTLFNFRPELSKTIQPLFFRAVKHAFSSGDSQKVLLLTEMAKARSLLDISALKELIPSLLAKTSDATELELMLAQHEKTFMDALARSPNGLSFNRSDERISTLEFRISKMFSQIIEGQYSALPRSSVIPDYLASFLIGQVDVHGLIGSIPPKAAALVYFATPEEIIILLATREGIMKVKGFETRGDFPDLCRSVLLSVDRPHNQKRELLRYLYDVLIGSVGDAVPPDTELIYIVPHSYLNFIPFQCLLRSNKGRSSDYLVWHYDIVYAPSLSFLRLAIAERNRTKYSPTQ